MALPRMRTAEGVLRELRAFDPNTEISLHFVRKLILSGKLPVVCAGCRKMVDVDRVLDYLAQGEQLEDAQAGAAQYGQIRRII